MNKEDYLRDVFCEAFYDKCLEILRQKIGDAAAEYFYDADLNSPNPWGYPDILDYKESLVSEAQAVKLGESFAIECCDFLPCIILDEIENNGEEND